MRRIRALRGPNYWRLAPVIACDVRLGELEELTSVDIPGFIERLIEGLPSLCEHPCSRGSTGGFVDRLREGTHWPHILEHVALELQTLAARRDGAHARRSRGDRRGAFRTGCMGRCLRRLEPRRRRALLRGP